MKRSTLLAALLLGALLSSFMATLRTAQTVHAQPANQLVYVGDSLTEGFGATTQAQAYAYLTGALTGQSVNVQAQYGVTAVFTASEMAGETGPVVPTSSARVIIELGTNDVQAILDGTETLADFAAAYRQILSLVHHSALKAQIICIGPWQDGSNQWGDAAWITNFIAAYCPGKSMPLDDLYANASYHGPAGRSTWLGTADYFHPNDAGHAAIAQRLVALIA